MVEKIHTFRIDGSKGHLQKQFAPVYIKEYPLSLLQNWEEHIVKISHITNI